MWRVMFSITFEKTEKNVSETVFPIIKHKMMAVYGTVCNQNACADPNSLSIISETNQSINLRLY